jgi:hypothetical protein
MQKIPNAHIAFQECSASGMVYLYLNSFADTAIEVMVDATQSSEKSKCRSQDIDEHLERFRDGKYDWKRYVLFNFAMKNDKVVLPWDTSAHDKVYTFVRSTNTLYRGMKPIKFNAVTKRSGRPRPIKSGQTRSFSTMLRCAGDTRPAHFSLLKNLATCIRRL